MAQPAQPDDPVDGWLPPALAEQLVATGVLTLAQLLQRIDRGGRWWRGVLRACGPIKAQRLVQHLALLMARPGRLEGPSCASVTPAAVATWLPAVLAPPAAPRDRVSLTAVARLLFGPSAGEFAVGLQRGRGGLLLAGHDIADHDVESMTCRATDVKKPPGQKSRGLLV